MAGGTSSSAATASLRQRMLEAAAVVVALWYLGSYLALALARIGYPYDLEWMEGGSLEHVARVLGGQPLYVPPSLDFTPYIYAPLYYYVAAPFAKLFGLGLPPLRLVSLAASLGVFALLAALVHGRTRSKLGALFAAGLFAALFARAGAFFDLARVDSLALLLTLLPVWLLVRSERHDLVAGALLAAAFFTKQNALLIAAPVVLARTWSLRGPRRLRCAAAFVVLAAGGTLALHLCTQGWSTYYLFTLPAAHHLVSAAWLGYWRDDLLLTVPVALLAAVFCWARPPRGRAVPPVELAAVLGCLAASWSARLHSGAFSNVLMPVYAALAWQAGNAVGWLAGAHAVPGERSGGPRPWLFPAALGACLVQLALLWFPPWRQVPTAADRAAGAALVAEIAAVPGPVLVPFHPHLARLAGKATHAHEMAMHDVLRAGPGPAPEALAADVRRRLQARDFGAVIVDQDWWPAELGRSYVRARALFPDLPGVFWPRTGWQARPREVHEPRPR